MFGHLSSLKYEHDGTMVAVPIDENIVRLPLEAFKLHCWQGGENIGVIPITVTCSVGRQHMPEEYSSVSFLGIIKIYINRSTRFGKSNEKWLF